MKLRPVTCCECGDHAWVPLTQGQVSLIDPEFAPAIGLWNWYAKLEGMNWYAARGFHIQSEEGRIRLAVRMHQVILPVPRGYMVDHANGHTLDNRRSNLRAATASQNCSNSRAMAGKTSVYKGVSRSGSGWRAMVGFNREQFYLGRFDSEESAARAYDQEAAKRHGDFARPNFPKTSAVSERQQP